MPQTPLELEVLLTESMRYVLIVTGNTSEVERLAGQTLTPPDPIDVRRRCLEIANGDRSILSAAWSNNPEIKVIREVGMASARSRSESSDDPAWLQMMFMNAAVTGLGLPPDPA